MFSIPFMRCGPHERRFLGIEQYILRNGIVLIFFFIFLVDSVFFFMYNINIIRICYRSV